MADRRRPKRSLESGNVPERFDDVSDTNVDERPAVPLSPLDDDPGSTTVDPAPAPRSPAPTVRKDPSPPKRAPLTRPVRERHAPSARGAPAPSARGADARGAPAPSARGADARGAPAPSARGANATGARAPIGGAADTTGARAPIGRAPDGPSTSAPSARGADAPRARGADGPSPGAPADAPKRLRLPLPSDGVTRAPEAPSDPAERAAPPPARPAARPLGEAAPRRAVPTLPGVRRCSQIPLVLALSAVALVVVAFFVADGASSSDEPNRDDPSRAALADARRTSASPHPAGLGADPHEAAAGVDGVPSPHGAAGRKAVVRAPSVPVRRDRTRSSYPEELGHAKSPDAVRAALGTMPKYDDDEPPTLAYPLLAVQSNPTRVPVYLDGVLLGNTPVLVPLDPKLKNGSLRFARPGVKEKTTTFSVTGPGTVEVFQELEEDPEYLDRLRAKSKTQGPSTDGKAKKN